MSAPTVEVISQDEVTDNQNETTTPDAAAKLAAGSRRVLFRHRDVLAPFKYAAGAVALGVVGWLADFLPDTPTGLIGIATAALTAIAGLVLTQRNKEAITRRGYTARAFAGAAAAAVWCGLVPVTIEYTSGMALGLPFLLLAVTVLLSAKYWKSLRVYWPEPARRESEPELIADPEPESELPDLDDADTDAFPAKVIAAWDEFVAGQGTLPKSTIDNDENPPSRINHGWAFVIRLVRGKQKLADVRRARAMIASGLNIPEDKITFDPFTDADGQVDQTVVIMNLKTETPQNLYDGPKIHRRGGDIFIEIGPYEDGSGAEVFHVLSGQLTDEELAAGGIPEGSMNGGFVLGTKGAGKSRLIENVAIGLRKLGVELWYLDPQEGNSSPALIEEADWPLRGTHGPVRQFGNVLDLYHAMKRVATTRSKEAAVEGHPGFQHTRERPAIAVIIDECHAVFAEENPETGNSFGWDFGDLDRIIRKNGMGIFGASQVITADTFGGSLALRDGLCSGNTFVMMYLSKNNGSILPGFDGQEFWNLDPKGFGYNFKGEKPHTIWRNRRNDDPKAWLQMLPAATLDVRAQRSAGTPYERRFETAAESADAAQRFIDALDAGVGDLNTLFNPPGTDEETETTGSSGARRTAPLLPSAAARRAATEDNEDGLTDRQREILKLLAEAMTVDELADELGVTGQTVRNELRRLEPFVDKLEGRPARYRRK